MQIDELRAKLSRQLAEAVERHATAKADVDRLQFALSTLQDVTVDTPETTRGRRPLLTRQNGYGRIKPGIFDVIAQFEKAKKTEFRAEDVRAALPFLTRPHTVSKTLNAFKNLGMIAPVEGKRGVWCVIGTTVTPSQAH